MLQYALFQCCSAGSALSCNRARMLASALQWCRHHAGHGCTSLRSCCHASHAPAEQEEGPHNEAGSLGVLLSNLLALHSMRVLFAEGQIGDGHIVQHDVEEVGALREDSADVTADNLIDTCGSWPKVSVVRNCLLSNRGA